MTLTQLQAFITSASCGTFTKAAYELRMSQPAISELVRRLEEELGTPLFHRGARALVLTSAGEQLLPHAQQSIASAQLGARVVRSQLELGGGTATFGLLRNADYYLRTDLALGFHARYPNVRVRLVGQNSAETASDVASGALEAGLVTLPVFDDGLEVVPLVRDEIVFVTSNRSRARRPRTFRAFVDSPTVLYDAHYSDTDPARRQLSERTALLGATLEPVIEVEYLGTALALVAAGVGDSIICRAALDSDSLPTGLYTASFTDPLYDTLALIKRRGLELSPATREMARMAYDALLEHQSTGQGTAEVIADKGQLRRFFGIRGPNGEMS